MMTLVGEIPTLSEKITKKAVVETLFNAVPAWFGDNVNTIKQWGDLKRMIMAEAVGRVAAYEENQRGHRRWSSGNEDQLMLMTQALEQLMNGKKSTPGASSSGGGHGRGGGRGCHDRADGGQAGRSENKDAGKQKKLRKFDIMKVYCFNCNEMGHFKSDCPERKRDQANIAQVEDVDDPGLLIMDVYELTVSEPAPTDQVLQNEEKMVPKLTGAHDVSWFLDTGASNHMTDNQEKFAG